jgi:hypothetical protein
MFVPFVSSFLIFLFLLPVHPAAFPLRALTPSVAVRSDPSGTPDKYPLNIYVIMFPVATCFISFPLTFFLQLHINPLLTRK